MTFALHPQLAADTLPLGDLGLSRLLLMNDARFPWLILVPRHEGATEILDLAADARAMLMEEVVRCCEAIRAVARPDKLNVAALGNRVAQLHVHVIGRFVDDAAWPDPVWGRGPAEPYAKEAGRRFAAAIGTALGLG